MLRDRRQHYTRSLRSVWCVGASSIARSECVIVCAPRGNATQALTYFHFDQTMETLTRISTRRGHPRSIIMLKNFPRSISGCR